jgi:hypothetical protein
MAGLVGYLIDAWMFAPLPPIELSDVLRVNLRLTAVILYIEYNHDKQKSVFKNSRARQRDIHCQATAAWENNFLCG